MKEVSERVRSLQEVIKDGLYPGHSPMLNPETDDRRHQAIAEVLCRLPQRAYEKVKRRKRSFAWLIPNFGTQGLVDYLFPNVRPRVKDGDSIPRVRHGVSILKPYARFVYLSPLLELRAWDSIVLVVVHELAHIVLNHALISHEEETDNCEEEVFRLVCAWGFEREAKRAEAIAKAINSDPAPAEKLASLMPLVWAAGIETLQCSQEERPGEASIDFAGSGDVEMFLSIAGREYKVEVEQWDEGGDNEHSFRVRFLVFFPIGDTPFLVNEFTRQMNAANRRNGER